VEESAVGVLEAALTGVCGVRRMRPVGSRQRELAEAAKAAINMTLAGQGGLGELARSLGASVFHLCRVFRACAGTTLHRYRSDLRIRRSLELLDGQGNGGDDILAIAVALGYSSHSHFTDAFGKAFGLAPSQFRECSRRLRARLRQSAAGAAR
jgi:AraC-like DNA-binding protein